MKLLRIPTYRDLNAASSSSKYKVQKIEYFHHYWSFLFHYNSSTLMIDNKKFESHRSLFYKLDVQLNENQGKYPRAFYTFFCNHPFFLDSNIFIKSSESTKKKISDLKDYFQKELITPKGKFKPDEKHCKKHLPIIRKRLKEIEKKIISKSYCSKAVNHLIRIVNNNSPLSSNSKSDLKFLINTIVVELYFLGYTLNKIKNLSNVILFPTININSFPFEKTQADFTTEKEYKAYKEQTITKLTIGQQFKSILNLINSPKKIGNYIFKIDGIDFQNPKELKIWNAKFYNPQIELKVKCLPKHADIKEYINEIENYFDDYVKDEDKPTKQSKCNVIIEAEYHPSYFNDVDNDFYKAVIEANKALHVFRNLYKFFVNNNLNSVRVDVSTCILTNNELVYLKAIDYEFIETNTFQINQFQGEIFERIVNGINKLDLKNPFQRKLADSYSTICEIQTNSLSFSFKNYWTIIYESLFPNKKDEAISFIKKCFARKLKDTFFVDAKLFLNNSLTPKRDFTGLKYYNLNEETLKKLGIDIQILTPIKAIKFKKNYSKIKENLNFEFLTDIIDEIKEFENHNSLFLEKVDSWIEQTINEVYIERNLETHNNISTNLSLLKLRDDFLYISKTVMQTSFKYCNHKTNSIDDIYKKL